VNPDTRVPDFDELVALHQQDPQAFEILRAQLLDEAVQSAPAEHRPALEQVRERIEEARRSAATPFEAAVIATRMMQESVGRLMVAWKHVQCTAAEVQAGLLLQRFRLPRSMPGRQQLNKH